MNPIVRNILAAFAALVVGAALIMAVQALSAQLFPLPPGIDPADPEQLAAAIEQLPLAALWMVELSYVLGSAAAGALAARLAGARPLVLAGVVGAVLTLTAVMNLISIPHPLWLAVLNLVTFIPLALLGGKLGARGRGEIG